MDNQRKMLVAIDFSNFSLPVLRYALALATDTGAEVTVINVINERDVEAIKQVKHLSERIDEKSFVENQEKSRSEMVDELIEEAGCGNVKVSSRFRVGVPAAEILKAIEDVGADLLVIGTKGKTNLAEMIFGSTAEKVYRRSPVTVLSVRGREHADLVCRFNPQLS